MPGWQKLYEESRDQNFEIVSVAVDVQGAEKAKPWLEKANARYTALIDTDNKMSSHFNVNYIPLTVLFDESGKVVRGPQYFNGNKAESYQEIGDWVRQGEAGLLQKSPRPEKRRTGFETAEAELRFRFAAQLMKRDQEQAALHQLKAALEQSPENLLILKQIWAIEHPEHFYEGEVDFGWQREQFQRRAQERKAKSN